MLSRKYYKMIAKAIKDNTMMDTMPIINKDRLIDELCDEFKQDNSLIDSDRFTSACNGD